MHRKDILASAKANGFVGKLTARKSPGEKYTDLIKPVEDKATAHIINYLINSGRLHFNPQQFHIIERSSTAIMVNESITAPQAAAHRKYLIKEGLEHNGPISDHANLCALYYLKFGVAEDKDDPKVFLLMGFAIWLMDYVSRHPNNLENPDESITFFGACRMHDFAFDADGSYPVNLEEKFLKVLETLKISDHKIVQQVVKEWCSKGTYTVPDNSETEEDTHDEKLVGGEWTFSGAWTILARQICKLDKLRFFQISACISYALGNRDLMRKLNGKPDSDKLASAHTCRMLENIEDIRSIVQLGDDLRHQRIDKMIDDEFPVPAADVISEEGRKFFKNLLRGLPAEAIRIFYVTNFSLAYTHSANISTIYPDKVPGLGEKGCKIIKKAPGLITTRFSMLFMADGFDVVKTKKVGDAVIQETVILTPEEKLTKLRQTLLHEIGHLALNSQEILNDEGLSGTGAQELHHRSDSIIGRLKSQIRKACDDLRSLSEEDKGKYLGATSLLDPSFSTYEIFAPSPPGEYGYTEVKWKEELFVNMYAAMNGQYAKRKAENNPFRSDGDDASAPWQIQQLREAARLVDKTMKIIDQRLCKSQKANKIVIPDKSYTETEITETDYSLLDETQAAQRIF